MEPYDFYIILWTTEDGKEHHDTLADCDDIKERLEKCIKEMWQKSILKSKSDKSRIKYLKVAKARTIECALKMEQVVTGVTLDMGKK